jgi:DUF4097 and DUF4098 domain-containing protein YvlB
MRHQIRLFLGLLAIIGLRTLTVSAAGQGDVQTKSFAISQGGSLELVTGAGDVRITTWEKAEVHIEARGVRPEDVDRLDMTQLGASVRVEYRPPRRSSRGIRFEISVPAHFNLNIRTSGGDIRVQGTLTGDATGQTAGGDVTIGNVNGKVDVSTSGGDVRVGRVQGDASMHTSGGDVHLEMAAGEVDAHTAGGDIRIGTVGRTITAKTAGGDMTVGDVSGDAKISTAGGDINVGRVSGGASLDTAGGDISLREATGQVKAQTAGGDIHLENVSGSLEANTAGGDIEATLNPSGTGSSRLVTAGGDIKLYLPETAGVTIDARIRIKGDWDEHIRKYDIHSDFEAQTYRKDEAREEIRATFTINGGGQRIWLETVNGHIEIRRSAK